MNSPPLYAYPPLYQGFPWFPQPQNPYFQPNNFYRDVVFPQTPFNYHSCIVDLPSIPFPSISLGIQPTQSPLSISNNENQRGNKKDSKLSMTEMGLREYENDESEYSQSLSESGSSQKKIENKIFKKHKQSAQRNIMTNIGNQLMTFLGSRKRSQSVFLRVNENATKQEISDFYSFINKLRKMRRSPLYINRQKLIQLWYPSKKEVVNSKNYQNLRRLSLIFIQEFLPLCIVNSARIGKQSRLLHISGIRKFLHLLRYRR